MDRSIQANANIHNRISREYDSRHREIFNPIEQRRLHAYLKYAVSLIDTGSTAKLALDYGCGSGNVTGHLIKLGLQVVSADVSNKFLKIVENKFTGTRQCSILKINGRDLNSIKNDSFDCCAVYSVLHHVPDYLALIKEIVRVTKPGGIIYLDHEQNEAFWTRTPEYMEFQSAVRKIPAFYFNKILRKYLTPSNYYHGLRRLFNSRYQAEGDIHVWQGDHVEWPKIESALSANNCEMLFIRDYLLYNNYPLKIYHAYKNLCSDYCCMAARKIRLSYPAIVR